jgi:hypothetical protein
MQPSVIVWDLETVPDLGGFAAANDLVGKSDIEIREAIGDKFPKHILREEPLKACLPRSFLPAGLPLRRQKLPRLGISRGSYRAPANIEKSRF